MSTTGSFQVFQASAGSGKTYTIVREYLKLCLMSEARTDNFRHILAITFTNAAANEMKAKIIKQLREMTDCDDLGGNPLAVSLMDELGLDATRLKRNAQTLMTRIIHDYSSFCVSTIDAFVQKLSRSFAHDLGLPSQYTVSIDTDEVVAAITENIGLQIDGENRYLVQLLMDFSANQFANERSLSLQLQLSEFVKKLMDEKAYQTDGNNSLLTTAQYDETLAFLNGKMELFEKEVKGHVEAFQALVKRFRLDNEDFAYGNVGFVSYIGKLAKRSYEKPSARFLAVAEGGKWFSGAAKRKFQDADLELIGNEIAKVLEPLSECCRSRLGAFLFYKAQRDLLYLYALRTQIKAAFEKLAQENEVVHISEFNKLLNGVMGDFSVPFVYERIGEHFRHVFIDEFQDTSVLQWQNLLPLFDNGLSSGSMSMVVGDGKQSIYRFRSGEVGQIIQLPEIYALPNDERREAFLQYQRNLEEHFSFHNLEYNFRSFRNVVRFNNAFFKSALPVLPEPLQKVYQDENEAFGKTVSIAQKARKTDEGLVQVELYRPDNQPNYCFERIEELVRDLTSEKGYRYDDITILIRRKEYGASIANYLNDKGIPVVSQESILLQSSDQVQLVVNTLRYLLHPNNEVYVCNVLYYRMLTTNPDSEVPIDVLFSPAKAVAEGKKPMEAELQLGRGGELGELFSRSTCLYDLCSSLIVAYGLNVVNDAFLAYFLDEVFGFQSGLKEGIEEFLAFWDKKHDKLAVKSTQGNAVNIMTIHKSKGLEFNVIIYPDAIVDPDERLRKNAAAELWLRPEELRFEAIPNLDKVLFKLNASAANMGENAVQLIENEKGSNRLDNLNLLYVAFTRAKQRLYVIGQMSPDSAKPNLLREFVEANPVGMEKLSDDDSEILVYRLGDDSFINPEASLVEAEAEEKAICSVSMDWFSKIALDPSPSMFWASPDDPMQPREWGDLVHEILSGIGSFEDSETALNPYLQEGIINQEMADILNDRIKKMVHHPVLNEAFSVHAKVKNECEILSDGDILRPDRYAELPDVIYLIDYKTGKKKSEHRNQLKRYFGALQGIVSKQIRAYLVYLSDAVEVEEVVMDSLF